MLKLVAAVAFLACSLGARAGSITISPSSPTSTSLTIATVSGVSTSFLGAAYLHALTIQGNSISIQICFPMPTFPPAGGPFQLVVPLGSLPAGQYTVTSYTADCLVPNDQPLAPFTQTAVATFSVLASQTIPTLDPLLLLGLTVLILWLTHSRGLTRRSTRTPAGGLSPARRSPVSLLR
jgi:hypothetical protein